MKGLSSIKQLALLALCCLVLAGDVQAQTLTILHNFGDGSVPSDGQNPEAALIHGVDGKLYGTTYFGGSICAGIYRGAVFDITTSGTVAILHDFGDYTVATDGLSPDAAMVQGMDGNFYGTTQYGGDTPFADAAYGDGIVFKITPQGTLTTLHKFGDGTVTNDGLGAGALVRGSDGNFYGTTSAGGYMGNPSYPNPNGQGTIFKITPQGTVTILHSFGDGTVTNDGSTPFYALIEGSDGNFYGTTGGGGSAGDGTIFKMTPQGVVTILHSFGDDSVTNDGSGPSGGLIQAYDGNFYGMAGNNVFKMTPQGVVTVLHSFGDGSTLNDGAYPNSSLVQGSDGNFYGTTFNGGSAGDGTIFKITTQGVFTVLHSFHDGSTLNDGIGPKGGLIQGANGTFYGTTSGGGSVGDGTVFAFNPATSALTSAATASGSVSLPFSYQTMATNNPTSYAATNLPDGLSIDPIAGTITGTPTTVQTNIVTLTFTNAAGSYTSALTITIGSLPVPSVTSILSSYGSVGTTFSYQTTANNLTTSYSASGLTGTGLSLNSATGIISGTPTSTGTFSVTLTATNTSGTSIPVTLSIQISPAPPTLSQEYNVLHHFGDISPTNDGYGPATIFQAFDGNFYGVTGSGVFKMTQQGTLSIFTSFAGSAGISNPTSLIQASDGNFYGTTKFFNGTTPLGQIFKLTPSGQPSILHVFTFLTVNGAVNGQVNALIQGYDGNLYGTTSIGGSLADTDYPSGQGTVFKITPQGVFTVLHTFGDGSVTNDGIAPQAALVQGTDGSFYGTTQYGGLEGFGTVFKITPQGTYSILHNFPDGTVTNDGFNPQSALIQSNDGNLYGTTSLGGSDVSYTDGFPYGQGTVFKITVQGTGYTILHYFGDGSVTNDGANPDAALLQGYDGNLYGTTSTGGGGNDQSDTLGAGTVFKMTPLGTVTIIHSFSDGSVTDDGIAPLTPLIQSSAGNFYGVTLSDGVNFGGIVYSVNAMQIPTHVPIYIGAAYQEASIFAPFFFTPKASFGVSGSGVENQGNAVQPQTAGGIMDALVSLFVPQSITKFFSVTNWSLNEQGVGSIPPNTLQPLYLNFDPTSGTISGTPTQAGTFALTMTPGNVVGSGVPQAVTIYIDVPPSISSSTTVTGSVGTSFSYQIASTPPDNSYGATNLPNWLSADPVSGLISGTPPAAGTYVFNTIATNSSGQTVQPVALTVTGGSSSVPAITSSTVASGAIGSPFTYHIATSHPAASFTAVVPPNGLLFDEPSGTILGTPNTTGFFQIPITATNASGSSASVLSLTVTPPTAPTIASSLTALAAEGAPFTYTIPATGVVSTYAETGALPAGLSFNASTGVFSGTPTATGTFPLSLTVSNDTGIATSILTLNVQVPTDYGSWTTTYGVTGGANGSPYHDGVPNLLKYLCDVTPSTAISASDRAALPVVGSAIIAGTDCLTLTYRQSALESGLTINVQTSPDMHTWNTVATEPSSSIVQVGTDSISGDPIYQAQVPVSSTPQFIRLNITSP